MGILFLLVPTPLLAILPLEVNRCPLPHDKLPEGCPKPRVYG
jgi:hypothetical protein